MNQSPTIDPKEVAKTDPFPGIPPALLNSADIAAYAESLYPPLFTPFDKKLGLKPATYEVTFEGDVYLWRDEKSLLDKLNPFYDATAFEMKLEKHQLARDDDFTIPPNSIVFASPATYFRIPDFLALRFNLHIKLVHRGLLLGTGPLVDPGFSGRLLIPLHNLTSHPLRIKGGQGFIWIEVTKISPLRPNTEIVPFKEEKKGKSAKDYFQSASNLDPIVSTLHVTSEKINSYLSVLRRVSVVGGVALVVGLASLTYACWSLINDTHHYVTDARKSSDEDLEKIKKEFAVLQGELETLKAKQAKSSSQGVLRTVVKPKEHQ